jgi:hypothetical protein
VKKTGWDNLKRLVPSEEAISCLASQETREEEEE